jgi:hypothetical protein
VIFDFLDGRLHAKRGPIRAVGRHRLKHIRDADNTSLERDFIAVSRGVWDYPQGPAAAVRDFNGVFAGTRAT